MGDWFRIISVIAPLLIAAVGFGASQHSTLEQLSERMVGLLDRLLRIEQTVSQRGLKLEENAERRGELAARINATERRLERLEKAATEKTSLRSTFLAN